jgi:hypothetical protein
MFKKIKVQKPDFLNLFQEINEFFPEEKIKFKIKDDEITFYVKNPNIIFPLKKFLNKKNINFKIRLS